MEFDQTRHDQGVLEGYKRIARVALFEEMMDFVDKGMCSFEEAVAQYKHDAAEIEVEKQ